MGESVKIREGQDLDEALSAETFNALVDHKDEAKRRRFSQVNLRNAPDGPIPTDVVRVKNNGGSLARGSVVGIGALLVTGDLDPRCLTYQSATPDDESPWGILRHHTPSGEVDEALLTGVCIARVNVSDIEHRYARVTSGSNVLASAGAGPVRLVRPATGTGEQELVVHLHYEPRVELVELLSLTKVDDFYPGKILYYDPQTNTYSDGPDVWLVDANE